MAWQLLATVFATYLFGSFMGWVAHWVFHRPWSGRLHRAHMAHHLMYPRQNFLSDVYMDVGADSGTLFFTAAGIAVTAPPFAALWALGLPWWVFATVAVEGALIGAANGYVHDALHVRGHWLGRFRWFERLRILHIVHHANVRVNLGIYDFWWDRILGTYRHVTLHRNAGPVRPADHVRSADSK